MARFQIWTTDSRNLVGEYRTEAEALDAVLRDIERLGRGCTRNLAIGDVDGGPILTGSELVRRATEHASKRRLTA